MYPAQFSEPAEQNAVICRLCAFECMLRPGQTGRCHVRHNVDGRLTTSVYGQPAMIAVEPIEKKYLFHAFPGQNTLSLGTLGCNLACDYCINWRISQRGGSAENREVLPNEIVAQALAEQVGCIAFTYTEPTIFYEYAQDVALEARQAGLHTVAKSNGYMGHGVLEAMAEWLDAINIDLKGWTESSHRHSTGGSREPVIANLKLARRLGVWLEVSTLLVPTVNDSAEEIEAMARFIADELGVETPWHLLRFFPNYHMTDLPVTADHKLQEAVEIGAHLGLRYLYAKDLSPKHLNTVCPHCGSMVIERDKLRFVSSTIHNNRCGTCGQSIAGIGLE